MILSVSRRTDIPAFYHEWFLNRIKEGFVVIKNPKNEHQIRKVNLDPEVVDSIVFWTKNPGPMIPYLDELNSYSYYFLYTINPYDRNIEKDLPAIDKRLRMFKTLSEKIGKNRIVWRYDPIIFSKEWDVDYHIEQFDILSDILKYYTDTVIISFLQFYRVHRKSLLERGFREPDSDEVRKVCVEIVNLCKKKGLKVQSCAEEKNLIPFGVFPGKCVDDERISGLLGEKIKGKTDPSLRNKCLCIESIDVGAYNSCLYDCIYCYANNIKKDHRISNAIRHNKNSPILLGEIEDLQNLTEREAKSFKMKSEQLDLFDEFD